MKSIFIAIMSLVAVSTFTSCQKEYNCQCDNFSVIVEANSQNDAKSTCDTKGTNCEVK